MQEYKLYWKLQFKMQSFEWLNMPPQDDQFMQNSIDLRKMGYDEPFIDDYYIYLCIENYKIKLL